MLSLKLEDPFLSVIECPLTLSRFAVPLCCFHCRFEELKNVALSLSLLPRCRWGRAAEQSVARIYDRLRLHCFCALACSSLSSLLCVVRDRLAAAAKETDARGEREIQRRGEPSRADPEVPLASPLPLSPAPRLRAVPPLSSPHALLFRRDEFGRDSDERHSAGSRSRRIRTRCCRRRCPTCEPEGRDRCSEWRRCSTIASQLAGRICCGPRCVWRCSERHSCQESHIEEDHRRAHPCSACAHRQQAEAHWSSHSDRTEADWRAEADRSSGGRSCEACCSCSLLCAQEAD